MAPEREGTRGQEGREGGRQNIAISEVTTAAGEKTSRERILAIEIVENVADITPQGQKRVKNVKDKLIINLKKMPPSVKKKQRTSPIDTKPKIPTNLKRSHALKHSINQLQKLTRN